MATSRLDVSSYLARIGYDGPKAPTLDVLAALQSHHIAAIPFETLAMILPDPIRLDLPALQQKVLIEGRGGYCFELNLLFLGLLRALGFDAHALTGRVLMNAADGSVPARTHVFLHVTIGGEAYIADVGFGGMTPTAPLRLDTQDIQKTPNDPYRITRNDDGYALTATLDGAWRILHAFDLTKPAEIDFEVGNWYVSTHPASPFRDRLLAARAEPGIRHTLRGADYAMHRIGAPSERRRIESPDDLAALLSTIFKIRLPAHPGLGGALARVVGC